MPAIVFAKNWNFYFVISGSLLSEKWFKAVGDLGVADIRGEKLLEMQQLIFCERFHTHSVCLPEAGLCEALPIRWNQKGGGLGYLGLSIWIIPHKIVLDVRYKRGLGVYGSGRHEPLCACAHTLWVPTHIWMSNVFSPSWTLWFWSSKPHPSEGLGVTTHSHTPHPLCAWARQVRDGSMIRPCSSTRHQETYCCLCLLLRPLPLSVCWF